MKIKYKPWAKVLMYLVEAIVIILSVFPILWVVMSSFKTNGEILSSPLALPAHFSLDTFIEIFQKYSFPTYFFNSLLAAGVSTLVSLLFYAMGAYVIAKFEFPGRKLLFALFTITLLVPSHSKTQPIFSLIMKLNLYDSIWGVTLVYLSAGMAMSIFVLKAGFMAIPKSLDEAATLDGASFFRTFWTINLPLAKSALATAGILMFLGNWNEYYFCLGLLHYRQAVLPAQFVGCRPELSVLAAALLVFLAVHIRYGIDNEVVVQVIRIHVGGNQHLETLAPDLACQRHADFVALLRGHLALAETLVGMERHHAVCFTKAFLYSPHIFPRMICPAMDAGDKLGALVQPGLGIILCVVQRLGKSIVFGLVWVGRIVKDALQAVLDCPNLSYRQ